MCVFWRSLYSKFLDWETILRDYCVDWIIGSVVWIAFISVFFSSWKTVLKSWLDTSWTPPRYLTIYRASQAFFLSQSWHLLDIWWIDRESSCLLDSSSIPGGSIELLLLDLIPCCSILSQYLSCQRPFSRHLPQQLPRHLSIPHLSSITERSTYTSSRNPFLISSISLNLSVPVHFPNTLISLQLCSSRFLQAFSSFSTLGKLLISYSSYISCFET